MSTDSTQKHWATLTGKELAAKVVEKFREFEDALRAKDLERMKLATYAYYGQDADGNETNTIGRKGEQDQIRHLMDNEYRAVLRNKLTIATSEPSGFVPVPSNSDSDSQASTVLARAVLDYYFDELKGDRETFRAAEASENLSWAWVDVPWNEHAGPMAPARPGLAPEAAPTVAPPAPALPAAPIDVQWSDDAGEPLEEQPSPEQPAPNLRLVQDRMGDVEVRFRLPTDVAFEYDARGETQWLIVRDWPNKYDVAAQVPPLPDGTPDQDTINRILALETESRDDEVSGSIRGWTKSAGVVRPMRSDEVPVLELRHRKTPGCPEGRFCRVVGGDIVLAEGPARYVDERGQDDLACYRIAAGERYGTPRAYTSAHDALGLQRAVDTLTSIPYSNQAAQGLNTIVAAEGSDLRPEDLRKGLMVLYAKGDPSGWPQRLDLAHTDPQIPETRMQFKADIGSKMGMDDQAMGRGTLPSSGALAALLDDKTQRSVSGLSKAYNELRREVATGILKRFQQFGHQSRTLPLMLGKSKRAVMGSFSKAELGGIDRVKVETTSSAMRTLSGRQAIFEFIVRGMAEGLPPEAIITFFETGKWEPVIEDQHAEMLTIREENERLLGGEALEPMGMDGAPLPPGQDGQPLASTALFTDHPLKHIMGHRPVLASPAARKNQQVVNNAGAHMMAHVRILMQWVAGDPLLVALHGPPPQGLEPPPLPEGEQGAAGGPAKPGPSAPPPGGEMPNPPKNPSTGNTWSPTGEVANG